jgi:hypothetical protein
VRQPDHRPVDQHLPDEYIRDLDQRQAFTFRNVNTTVRGFVESFSGVDDTFPHNESRASTPIDETLARMDREADERAIADKMEAYDELDGTMTRVTRFARILPGRLSELVLARFMEHYQCVDVQSAAVVAFLQVVPFLFWMARSMAAFHLQDPAVMVYMPGTVMLPPPPRPGPARVPFIREHSGLLRAFELEELLASAPLPDGDVWDKAEPPEPPGSNVQEQAESVGEAEAVLFPSPAPGLVPESEVQEQAEPVLAFGPAPEAATNDQTETMNDTEAMPPSSFVPYLALESGAPNQDELRREFEALHSSSSASVASSHALNHEPMGRSAAMPFSGPAPGAAAQDHTRPTPRPEVEGGFARELAATHQALDAAQILADMAMEETLFDRLPTPSDGQPPANFLEASGRFNSLPPPVVDKNISSPDGQPRNLHTAGSSPDATYAHEVEVLQARISELKYLKTCAERATTPESELSTALDDDSSVAYDQLAERPGNDLSNAMLLDGQPHTHRDLASWTPHERQIFEEWVADERHFAAQQLLHEQLLQARLDLFIRSFYHPPLEDEHQHPEERPRRSSEPTGEFPPTNLEALADFYKLHAEWKQLIEQASQYVGKAKCRPTNVGKMESRLAKIADLERRTGLLRQGKKKEFHEAVAQQIGTLDDPECADFETEPERIQRSAELAAQNEALGRALAQGQLAFYTQKSTDVGSPASPPGEQNDDSNESPDADTPAKKKRPKRSKRRAALKTKKEFAELVQLRQAAQSQQHGQQASESTRPAPANDLPSASLEELVETSEQSGSGVNEPEASTSMPSASHEATIETPTQLGDDANEPQASTSSIPQAAEPEASREHTATSDARSEEAKAKAELKEQEKAKKKAKAKARRENKQAKKQETEDKKLAMELARKEAEQLERDNAEAAKAKAEHEIRLAREQEAREREAREREAKEQEAREQEAKEREDGELEAKEREAEEKKAAIVLAREEAERLEQDNAKAKAQQEHEQAKEREAEDRELAAMLARQEADRLELENRKTQARRETQRAIDREKEDGTIVTILQRPETVPEAAQPEAVRQEGARQRGARLEAARKIAAREEAARQKAARQEAARQKAEQVGIEHRRAREFRENQEAKRRATEYKRRTVVSIRQEADRMEMEVHHEDLEAQQVERDEYWDRKRRRQKARQQEARQQEARQQEARQQEARQQEARQQEARDKRTAEAAKQEAERLERNEKERRELHSQRLLALIMANERPGPPASRSVQEYLQTSQGEQTPRPKCQAEQVGQDDDTVTSRQPSDAQPPRLEQHATFLIPSDDSPRLPSRRSDSSGPEQSSFADFAEERRNQNAEIQRIAALRQQGIEFGTDGSSSVTTSPTRRTSAVEREEPSEVTYSEVRQPEVQRELSVVEATETEQHPSSVQREPCVVEATEQHPFDVQQQQHGDAVPPHGPPRVVFLLGSETSEADTDTTAEQQLALNEAVALTEPSAPEQHPSGAQQHGDAVPHQLRRVEFQLGSETSDVDTDTTAERQMALAEEAALRESARRISLNLGEIDVPTDSLGNSSMTSDAASSPVSQAPRAQTALTHAVESMARSSPLSNSLVSNTVPDGRSQGPRPGNPLPNPHGHPPTPNGYLAQHDLQGYQQRDWNLNPTASQFFPDPDASGFFSPPDAAPRRGPPPGLLRPDYYSLVQEVLSRPVQSPPLMQPQDDMPGVYNDRAPEQRPRSPLPDTRTLTQPPDDLPCIVDGRTPEQRCRSPLPDISGPLPPRNRNEGEFQTEQRACPRTEGWYAASYLPVVPKEYRGYGVAAQGVTMPGSMAPAATPPPTTEWESRPTEHRLSLDQNIDVTGGDEDAIASSSSSDRKGDVDDADDESSGKDP